MNPFEDIYKSFSRLERIKTDPPLLAHYTDIKTAVSFLESGQLWLSNPLFMNDTQEITFGVLKGIEIVESSRSILNVFSEQQFKALMHQFRSECSSHRNEEVIDTYVFCLSFHDEEKDSNGRLSMWRAYGAEGHGAALVFDTAPLGNQTIGAPMFLTDVQYRTEQERDTDLEGLVERWLDACQKYDLQTVDIADLAKILFQIIILYALSTKHKGFEEEREWRLIYAKQFDPQELLKEFITYNIGQRGIEPKLKVPIEKIPVPGVPDISLELLLKHIIVGPSLSSPLALASVRKMLKGIRGGKFIDKVSASTIPFRAQFQHRPT
jgi:Protein of unknown function (DUF2971)